MIEVLNECLLGESHGDGIDGMVTMVVSFGPVVNDADALSVMVFIILDFADGFVFVPVQFLHYVHQSPVVAQSVGDGTRGGHYVSAYGGEHGQG